MITKFSCTLSWIRLVIWLYFQEYQPTLSTAIQESFLPIDIKHQYAAYIESAYGFALVQRFCNSRESIIVTRLPWIIFKEYKEESRVSAILSHWDDQDSSRLCGRLGRLERSGSHITSEWKIDRFSSRHNFVATTFQSWICSINDFFPTFQKYLEDEGVECPEVFGLAWIQNGRLDVWRRIHLLLRDRKLYQTKKVRWLIF